MLNDGVHRRFGFGEFLIEEAKVVGSLEDEVIERVGDFLLVGVPVAECDVVVFGGFLNAVDNKFLAKSQFFIHDGRGFAYSTQLNVPKLVKDPVFDILFGLSLNYRTDDRL